MTMNNIGTGEALDDSNITVQSEFLATREELGVLRNSAMHTSMKPHTGTAYKVLNYGRLQAYVVNPGVPTALSQELADTLTSYSPNEVSLKVSVSGATKRRGNDPNILKEIGYEMAIAYDRTEEMEGAAQFPSFVPVVGSAGTVCSPGALRAMASRLGYGNDRTTPEAPPKPWTFIMHNIHAAVVEGRMISLSDTGVGTTPTTGSLATSVTMGPAGGRDNVDEILRRDVGMLGQFAGAAFKVTPYIIPDSSDDCSGAIFANGGLRYISEVAYRADKKPLERDGEEWVGWGAYAFGLYKVSVYGVEGLFDASALGA